MEETLDRVETRYVELIAVMHQYNPFAEKAGMKKIAVKEGSEVSFNIADTLRDLGFNMQLIGSRRYVEDKLSSLSQPEIEKIRKAFLENRHPKFQKAFQSGTPYGKGDSYKKLIESIGLEGFAKIIVYLSELLQTKIYLFYDQEIN